MPFRTRSIEVLRDTRRDKGPSRAEAEAAEQFKRLHKVVDYLKEHGHGGCLVLPLPLKMLNSGNRHWTIEAALKKQYRDYCNLILTTGLVPPLPPFVPPHVTIEVQMYVYNPMDAENLAALTKFPKDWMKGKYFRDDSDKYLRVIMLPQIVDRTCPRLVIKLSG